MNEQPVCHVLLCEKDIFTLERITEYISSCSKRLHREIVIHPFQTADKELLRILQCMDRIDIVILDSAFRYKEGRQLWEIIGKLKPFVPMIFIGDEDDSIKTSRTVTIGLLTRPVDFLECITLFCRALGQVDFTYLNQGKRCLAFVINKKRILLKIQEIVSMEKLQKKVIIKTRLGRYEVRDTLAAMECRLPYYFLRISQSVIVNINEIHSIEGEEVILSVQENYKIGRTYVKKISAYLKSFI